ncbi:MAG: hypothetical protein WA432_04180 [Candidatus Babeliaceae bacterium]
MNFIRVKQFFMFFILSNLFIVNYPYSTLSQILKSTDNKPTYLESFFRPALIMALATYGFFKITDSDSSTLNKRLGIGVLCAGIAGIISISKWRNDQNIKTQVLGSLIGLAMPGILKELKSLIFNK